MLFSSYSFLWGTSGLWCKIGLLLGMYRFLGAPVLGHLRGWRSLGAWMGLSGALWVFAHSLSWEGVVILLGMMVACRGYFAENFTSRVVGTATAEKGISLTVGTGAGMVVEGPGTGHGREQEGSSEDILGKDASPGPQSAGRDQGSSGGCRWMSVPPKGFRALAFTMIVFLFLGLTLAFFAPYKFTPIFSFFAKTLDMPTPCMLLAKACGPYARIFYPAIFLSGAILWSFGKNPQRSRADSRKLPSKGRVIFLCLGGVVVLGLGMGVLHWDLWKWLKVYEGLFKGIQGPVVNQGCKISCLTDFHGGVKLETLVLGNLPTDLKFYLLSAGLLMGGALLWSLVTLMGIFAEEVFFRGFLQGQLGKKLQGKWKGTGGEKYLAYYPEVMVSSLVYGLVYGLKVLVPYGHQTSGCLAQGIFALLLGGFYGYAYRKTQRLWVSIALSLLVNLVYFMFFDYQNALPFG